MIQDFLLDKFIFKIKLKNFLKSMSSVFSSARNRGIANYCHSNIDDNQMTMIDDRCLGLNPSVEDRVADAGAH